MGAPVNPLTVFRVRVREISPAHTRFGVFAGPDVDHLGCAGELILRNEEFPAFMDMVTEYNERNEPAEVSE